MKTFTVIIPLIFLISACGGSGDSSDGGPPNIEGTYDLTSTECEGFFDTTVIVSQDGNELDISATTTGFNDASGTISDDEDVSVETIAGDIEVTCSGPHSNGIITLDCEGGGLTCQITYEEQ